MTYDQACQWIRDHGAELDELGLVVDIRYVEPEVDPEAIHTAIYQEEIRRFNALNPDHPVRTSGDVRQGDVR